MKKTLVFLFLAMSLLSFGENKYNIEEVNFKAENKLFYKQKDLNKILLNEKMEIFSKEDEKLPIFKVNFKEGKLEELNFSNENIYFSPQNKEEKFKFDLKRMNDKNFNGNLEYSKSKAEEMKKQEKNKETVMTYYSSSSASSMMSYSGDFQAKEVENFFEKFIKNNKDKKIIIKKSDVEALMSKK